MRTTPTSLAAAALCLALLGACRDGSKPPAERLTLTYFNVEHWFLCDQVVPIVHGLEQEFAGKLAFEILAKSDPGAEQRILAHGLDVHGMVITDAGGGLVWSMSGHDMTRAEVRAAIETALAR